MPTSGSLRAITTRFLVVRIRELEHRSRVREFEDIGVTVLVDRQLVALVWREGPTEERVANVERVLEQVARANPAGFGVAVVVGESVSLPSLALRERIVAVLRKVTPRVRTVAWVVPSGGFQGSLVRSLLTALFLVLRPAFEPRAFETAPDGVAHVASALNLEDRVRLDAFVAQIEASRALR